MKKNLKTFVLGVLGGILPLCLFLVYNSSTSHNESVQTASVYENQVPISKVNLMPSEIDGKLDFTKASEESVQSVVHVKTKVVRSFVQTNPFYEFFYGPGAGKEYKQYGSGSGSGVIVTADGYIVTNNHVVENASEVEVTLSDNTTFDAEVVGTDPSTDIAVLKIKKDNLRPMPIGNSDDVKVGQWVLAVGNPFNLTSTVTAGIVSATSRNINIIGGNRGYGNQNQDIIPIESFIQTDAAVNPGNSGGALINTQGELIGINTAIASQTGSFSGYSFAIPSQLATKVMRDIMDYGIVQRAFLGVSIADITQDLINEKKLDDSKGVYIAGVTKGSAADAAKIKEGDIILRIGTKEIKSVAELQQEIGERRPGDNISIVLKRGSDVLRTVVQLKGKDGGTDLITKEKISGNSALGAVFEELTSKEKKDLNINNGVKISSIGSGKLRALGLTSGVVITKINNEEVKSVKQLVETLNSKENRGVLLEIMTESGKKDFVGFGL